MIALVSFNRLLLICVVLLVLLSKTGSIAQRLPKSAPNRRQNAGFKWEPVFTCDHFCRLRKSSRVTYVEVSL